jgi:hypothetical protein
MNSAQEQAKIIYIGYHPRTQDGSSPQSRPLSDSIAIMDAFNNEQCEGTLRAEVAKIAFSDLCAVAVMDTSMNKVWQYL